MGKFDERALRMRKEKIDLFGDGAVSVVISRPERRALTHRELLPDMAREYEAAEPARLCFTKGCENEVRSIDGIVIFLSAKGSMMAMAGCPTCSRKSNEEILSGLREDVRNEFGLGAKPADADKHGTAVFEADPVPVVSGTVEGIELTIVDGHKLHCGAAEAFAEMLERHLLPRFVFAYRSAFNCYNIVRQIHLDFEDQGLDSLIECKVGFSRVVADNGKPIGHHAWIECNGWVIDAAGGALGHPVLFQRVEDYRAVRKLENIIDFDDYVAARGGDVE